MDTMSLEHLSSPEAWKHVNLSFEPKAICSCPRTGSYFVLCDNELIYRFSLSTDDQWRSKAILGKESDLFQKTKKARHKKNIKPEDIIESPYPVEFQDGICASDEPNTGALYVALQQAHVIKRYALSSKVNKLSIFAGDGSSEHIDGPCLQAKIGSPSSIACTSSKHSLAVKGPAIFFTDALNQSVRMIVDGMVSTLTGTGTFASDFGLSSTSHCSFSLPSFLSLATDELSLLISDYKSGTIFRMELNRDKSTYIILKLPTSVTKGIRPNHIIELPSGSLLISKHIELQYHVIEQMSLDLHEFNSGVLSLNGSPVTSLPTIPLTETFGCWNRGYPNQMALCSSTKDGFVISIIDLPIPSAASSSAP